MGWLSGWSHRKTVTITGQTGAGTDYQVNLSIGDASGGDFHLENHCTSFPNDITVTDNDQTTLLNHWVEDLTVDPISIWVEVADDLGSNADVCVYYTKSGESSASNISNTGLFGDDFPGSSLDGAKWTEDNAGSGAIIVAGSKVRLYAPDGVHTAYMYSAQISSCPCALRIITFDLNAIGNVNVQLNPSTLQATTDDQVAFGVYDQTPGGGGNSDAGGWIYYAATSEEVFRDANVGDTYDKTDVDVLLDSNRKAQFLVEGGDKGTSTNALDDETWRIRLYSLGSRGISDLYVSAIFLRKFLSPTEPAFSSAGSEESAGGRLLYGGLVNAGLVGGRLS